MPLDNLTDLLVFIRVADACSFTLAAERLGISRSAAGKCVTRLEARLATRLLQRTTRSVSLTEDGAVFYEYAQRILSQAEEAETALNTRRQTPRGRLRLDLPVSLGRLHILPILREFLTQWPEVDADVSFSDDYSDLVRDGIDVAIRVGGSDDSRLVRRVLAPHRLITCAAPDYLARHGAPAKPEALGDHETLVFSHQGLPAPGAIELTVNCTNSRCAAGCVSTTSRPCGMPPSPGPVCVRWGHFWSASRLRPARWCRCWNAIVALGRRSAPSIPAGAISPQGETVPGGDRTALAGQGDLGKRLARAIHAAFKASVRRIRR